MTSCFCFASEKVFIYAVTLTFKANCVNIIFGNEKKALDCLCGTHVFWVEIAGSHTVVESCFSCLQGE